MRFLHIKKHLGWYLFTLFLAFIFIFYFSPDILKNWVSAIVNSATVVSFIFIWILNEKVESLKEKYDESKDQAKLNISSKKIHLEVLSDANKYRIILETSPLKVSELEKLHAKLTLYFRLYFSTYDSTIKNDLHKSVDFLGKINLVKIVSNEKVKKGAHRNINDIIRLLEINEEIKKIDPNKLREKTEEVLKNGK